ncbi:MAG: glycosyltransferase family 4 protein [Hyphococcus sp.]
MEALDAPLILIVAGWVTLLVSLSASRLLSRSGMLPDRPNHRSSHQHVTSRAGGVAICGAWLAGVVIIAAFSGASDVAEQGLAFGGLALLAFCVGFADDKWSMSPYWKFAGQIAAAALFAAVFAPLAAAPAPVAGLVPLGASAGVALTLFWIVGFMNAYNFMDGANGVAAGTASVGLSVFAIIAAFSGQAVASAAAILLAIACFGFLPANLARGRLFMGDSGSQSVSFIIACLGVFAANASAGSVSALVMPVIFLPFLFDVAWTLAHRVFRKQNILAAHREHLYQILLRFGMTHLRVAMLYMGLTAFSSAAAILMLAAPPSLQWLAPALLVAVFSALAFRIHRDALKRGFFEDRTAAASAPQAPGAADTIRQAAE